MFLLTEIFKQFVCLGHPTAAKFFFTICLAATAVLSDRSLTILCLFYHWKANDGVDHHYQRRRNKTISKLAGNYLAF